MSSGPLPTRLILLNDLQHIAQGEKVRFLGCVSNYSYAAGTLTLQHACPPPPNPTQIALVDVGLLLETLKSTDTEIGEWMNVIGYVEEDSMTQKYRQNGRKQDGPGFEVVRVQAIMIWSAGGVKLKEYEEAVQKRKDDAASPQC